MGTRWAMPKGQGMGCIGISQLGPQQFRVVYGIAKECSGIYEYNHSSLCVVELAVFLLCTQRRLSRSRLHLLPLADVYRLLPFKVPDTTVLAAKLR
jgi:hypothetical protein